MAAPRPRRRASLLRQQRTIMFLLLVVLLVVPPVASLLPNGLQCWSMEVQKNSSNNNNSIGGNTRRFGGDRATSSVGHLGSSSFANMRRKKVRNRNTHNAERRLFLLAGTENADAATSSSGDAGRYARNDSNNNNKSGNQDDNNEDNSRATTTTALLVLMTVPVAWGTFEVAIRYIYAVSNIPTLWLTLAYYSVATAVLVPAAAVVARNTMTNSGHESSRSSFSNPPVMEEQEQETATTTTTPLQSVIITDAPITNHDHHNQNTKMTTITPAQRGGLELGTYLFVGNLCQVVGLQTIAADRAAFLLQLTTVFVPLAQQIGIGSGGGLLGESSSVSGTMTTTMDPAQSRRRRRCSNSISLRVWMACAVALLGVGCMGLDHPHTVPQIGTSTTSTVAMADGQPWSIMQVLSIASSSLQWSTGDTWIVLAAVSYTFHCIRLEGFAQQTSSAVQLAAWKAITETTWSALAIGTVMLLALATAATTSTLADSSMASFWIQTGQDCLDFITTVGISSSSSTSADHPNWIPALGAIVWTGLVPVAYTIAAQTYGQRRVRPVTANLIYTLQPVCTALLAYVLLHEQLGSWGYLGGTLIVGSTLLVVFTGPDQDESDDSSNDSKQLTSTTKIAGDATISSAGADAKVT